jgi:hypothetical protein
MNATDALVFEYPDEPEFSLAALQSGDMIDPATDVSEQPIRSRFLADRPTPDDWPIYD